MNTIKQFLEENNLKALKNRELKAAPFKKYLPLDKGNSKLHDSILSFSLLPVVTCKKECSGCYDLRSLRYPSVRAKRLYNTMLALHDCGKLANEIIEQVTNSKSVKFVRIHVGGDFFSKKYVAMWDIIISAIGTIKPDVKFYTYTKSNFLPILKSIDNLNIVDSILPSGNYNYDTFDKLREFKKNNKGYKICPATLKKENVICGNTCKLCMTNSKVLFVKH